MINRLPKSPVGYNELAGLLTAKGDEGSLATAEEVATKAVELDPKSGLYLDALGWVHFKQEKFDAALESLRKAGDMAPDNPEVQYHLGAALAKAGKVPESLIHLKLAIVNGAGSDVAKEATFPIASGMRLWRRLPMAAATHHSQCSISVQKSAVSERGAFELKSVGKYYERLWLL